MIAESRSAQPRRAWQRYNSDTMPAGFPKWSRKGVLTSRLTCLLLEEWKPAALFAPWRRLRMSILYELRYPTKWYTKLLMALLALVFFAVLATAAIAGFLVYRIVKPQRTSSEIDMESFPGKPDLVDFTVSGLGTRHGWFFPGLRGAPTIVLCHGYGSSRGELLTLVSALQDHQYNVFVFDFAAPLPFQKIFVALENDDVFDISLLEPREVRKFRRHPAKVSHHLARHLFALGVGPVRKGQPQIKLGRLLELWLQAKK